MNDVTTTVFANVLLEESNEPGMDLNVVLLHNQAITENFTEIFEQLINVISGEWLFKCQELVR